MLNMEVLCILINDWGWYNLFLLFGNVDNFDAHYIIIISLSYHSWWHNRWYSMNISVILVSMFLYKKHNDEFVLLLHKCYFIWMFYMFLFRLMSIMIVWNCLIGLQRNLRHRLKCFIWIFVSNVYLSMIILDAI